MYVASLVLFKILYSKNYYRRYLKLHVKYFHFRFQYVKTLVTSILYVFFVKCEAAKSAAHSRAKIFNHPLDPDRVSSRVYHPLP